MTKPSTMENDDGDEKKTSERQQHPAISESTLAGGSAQADLKCIFNMGLYREEWEKNDCLKEVCENFVQHMNEYGIYVVDKFLGAERGETIFQEVLKLQDEGLFKDGQLVRNNTRNPEIRGDQIMWVVESEPKCKNISMLVRKIDFIVRTVNKKPKEGVLSTYNLDGRTRAMVACYPGEGKRYVKHVDNPNKDGRCITAIYYLNKNWNSKEDGGLLRIFPAGQDTQVADIDPIFDRMVFFWSDRRNPHEVLPSFKKRYAITIWYFNAAERAEATLRRLKDVTTSEKKDREEGREKDREGKEEAREKEKVD